MKKILLSSTMIILLFNIVLSGNIFATQASKSTEEFLPGSSYNRMLSNIGESDNLRMTGSLTYSRFHDENQYGFRGGFDYYLTNYWSLLFMGHFALNKVDSFYHHFGGAGSNLHLIKLGNLDIFGGGTAGFTMVIHDDLPTKYPVTLDIHGGWTYFGKEFCITGEMGIIKAEYFSRSNNAYINLTQFYISGGLGIKIWD